MLNKFLKPGGCFLCPQNKLYNDILYKNLFYSYRHLTNDEFKLLEENTNLNIEYNWYLYYDYKNDITDYKNIITVKLFNQEPTPLVSIWNRDYEQLLPYNDKVTTINTEDDQIKTVFNDLKKKFEINEQIHHVKITNIVNYNEVDLLVQPYAYYKSENIDKNINEIKILDNYKRSIALDIIIINCLNPKNINFNGPVLQFNKLNRNLIAIIHDNSYSPQETFKFKIPDNKLKYEFILLIIPLL